MIIYDYDSRLHNLSRRDRIGRVIIALVPLPTLEKMRKCPRRGAEASADTEQSEPTDAQVGENCLMAIKALAVVAYFGHDRGRL